MAIEAERGCGFRKVGSLYFVGKMGFFDCDRLPMPLHTCPVCDEGIKVGRGFKRINPLALWGNHRGCDDAGKCPICEPTTEPGFIMRVGENYYPTPEDFVREGIEQGISKCIPYVPKGFKIGETIIFLAHKRACRVKVSAVLQTGFGGDSVETEQPRLIEADQLAEPSLGIFATFVPQRIETLIYQKDATEEEVASLAKRGITAVIVKDGDLDHKGKREE